MKKEILDIHAYAPQTPTWLLDNECLNMVEQIRIVTVPDREFGHDCQVEYVYCTPLGDREVWIGGSCSPLDTCESYIFQGMVITKEIFEAMYTKQSFVTNRKEFFDDLEREILTYWPQLNIAPDVLE